MQDRLEFWLCAVGLSASGGATTIRGAAAKSVLGVRGRCAASRAAQLCADEIRDLADLSGLQQQSDGRAAQYRLRDLGVNASVAEGRCRCAEGGAK